MVFRLWNKFQTKVVMSPEVGQGQHEASTSAQDLSSSARCHWIIMAFYVDPLCLEEKFPGKQSKDVLQRLAFTFGVQSSVSFRLHPAGQNGYYGAEDISCRHHKNGGVP
ncbi:hypothetical protein TNCV_2955261 [Trichonephila clavipes]|nr:hypothetical protein TNCV_2955261 [Trichonephila clavipes]